MDKTQSEVTDRIRSSIKKKLVELKLFVDDELPDYIMILIANKRSKHHMEKDLSLFLGNHTVEFTSWLWDLVNNLKINPKSKGSKVKPTVDINQAGTASEVKENKIDEDDVLNYDPEEDSLCLEDSNEAITNQCVLQTTITTTVENKIPTPNDFISQTITKTIPSASVSSINPIKEVTTQIKEDKKSMNVTITNKNDLSVKNECMNNIPLSKGIATITTVAPSKETLIANSNFQPRQTNVSTSISSVVNVKQRKYAGPAALQANKLLLKAVSDATKSVLNGRDVNEYYKPTPINQLSVSKRESIPNTEESPTEILKPVQSSFFNDLSFVESYFKKESVDPTALSHPQANLIVDSASNSDNLELELNNSNESYRSCQISAELNDSNEFYESYQEGSGLEDTNESFQTWRRIIPPNNETAAVKNPHFTVTLDGVDFYTLKRKFSIEEPMEIDEEDFPTDKREPECAKKQKLTERCKYWPACKNSDSCSYHHPTVPCKSFPDCKYGDKCLFIHPNCKFDSLCSKKECPYTHCSKRNFNFKPKPPSKPIKVHGPKLVCKYYPKCTAQSCRFLHPKLCRFGTKCRAPLCKYSHFTVPQRNQLKWIAND